MNKSFGEKLRQLRVKNGFTQQQLAEQLHMDRTSITYWELGRRMPDVATLLRLSEVLGVDIAMLMDTPIESEDSPNVLLVDDQPIILSGGVVTLREIMPKANVFGFTEPEDVRAFFKSNLVALVFLDIEMGITNGLDFARELLGISPRTNIIYLTAFPDYALGAWKTGASDFLVKPLVPEEVRLALSRLRYPVRGLL